MKYIRTAYRFIGDIYNKIEEKIMVYSLLFTVVLIFYQIVMRHVFNNSSFWSEELARYIFMWQIWIGASTGMRDDKHIKIELLTSLLKEKGKIFMALLSNILLFAFCVFLVIKGFEYISFVAGLNMETPALRIPFAIVYSCLPVSSVAMGLRLIGTMINQMLSLAGKPTKEQPSGGEA